jgi:hypothetical protein
MTAHAPTASEPHLERLRRLIEDAYRDHPTGTGGSFGEILCHEIHENGMTFVWLAQKWGIGLPTLGELVWDHCKRLQEDPIVRHEPNSCRF